MRSEIVMAAYKMSLRIWPLLIFQQLLLEQTSNTPTHASFGGSYIIPGSWVFSIYEKSFQ